MYFLCCVMPHFVSVMLDRKSITENKWDKTQNNNAIRLKREI